MGKAGQMHARGPVCASFIIAFVCAASLASPKSSQLIDQGLSELEKGRAEIALKLFTDATREDPTDAEAAFFAGVASNRLGRAQEALAQLSKARQLGSDHPDLLFETGWSLLTLRRWDEAIDQLHKYEAQHPARGQTAEFLGRAYVALGKYKEADAAFAEVLKRDPDLLPTVSVYRALLRQRQGDEAAARDEVATLLGAVPDLRLTQLIGSQLPHAAPYASSSDWFFAVGTALGYNSNVRGAKFFNLNADVPRLVRNSPFTRATVDTSYALVNDSSERLTVGYDLLADFYFRQETDPDIVDQTVFLEYWRALGDRFTTTLRIWDNDTFVGEERLRNQAAAQASLASRIDEVLFIEGSYRYAFDDYFIKPSPGLNPQTATRINQDAQMHTLTLAAELPIRQLSSRLRGGYFHSWNFARGDDFDYHGDGFFTGVFSSLPWRLTAEAFYVHTQDRYEDPNSSVIITSPGQVRPKRRDDIDSLTLRLTRPLNRHLNIYLEYNFNHDHSNLRGYDYEQHITSGGLIWQF